MPKTSTENHRAPGFVLFCQATYGISTAGTSVSTSATPSTTKASTMVFGDRHVTIVGIKRYTAGTGERRRTGGLFTTDARGGDMNSRGKTLRLATRGSDLALR